MTDITPALDTFFNGLLSCLTVIYDTLDSISFYGISLLDFFIWIFILSVVLPLILTVIRSRSVESRPQRSSRSSSEKGSDD